MLLFLMALFQLPAVVRAGTRMSILVTSNLQGGFSPEIENQDAMDPLLRLGQNILAEREKGADFYIDMGNALYPGILSKYSSGSIMMDFLDYFSCEALLVSSRDLQIGAKNIEFLQKSKRVRLLSANLAQAEKPLFIPWFFVEKKGRKVAFIGMSSAGIRFDMAEKALYDYHYIDKKKALAPVLENISDLGITAIILLSGLTLKETAGILESHPEIGLALCGGDYASRFVVGKASRVDLGDGRSIMMADAGADYYLLSLAVDDHRINVQAMASGKADAIPTMDDNYMAFKKRLTLWKESFLENARQLVAEIGEAKYEVNDRRFCQLLRDRFDCEASVVEKGTLSAMPVQKQVNQSDVLGMVNQDYTVFVFSLTGSQLRAVLRDSDDLVIAGVDTPKGNIIQGSAIESDRSYRVAATQPAMQKVTRLAGKDITYRNTWKTVTDLLVDDLNHRRAILLDDYDYLDRRFRMTVDAYMSNFVENSVVTRGESIDTPPGQPGRSYNKWGLENRIDIAFYNKYHRFLFTPYMFYSRQDESYLNNILRGTVLYDYYLSDTIKPYNKFQCDTVVEEEDGKRPVLIRETMGVSTKYKALNAKLGLGIEKEVQAPSNPAFYGLELVLGAKIPFLSHFTYTFDLDSFGGFQNEEGGQRQIRTEINNKISADINAHLSLSFRHKYFWLYEDIPGETYQNSQLITSLDLKNGWKFW
jgi:2',3'-cyclic-nucleotide 2'-phosphodiesterase (5'-nucleotidase family)